MVDRLLGRRRLLQHQDHSPFRLVQYDRLHTLYRQLVVVGMVYSVGMRILGGIPQLERS